jgi:hypothetical protein
MQVTAQPTASPTENLQSTNLYARFKDKAPKLNAEQVEAYLKANGRNASSLLAPYRTSGDPALLKEAMETYPTTRAWLSNRFWPRTCRPKNSVNG